MNMVNMTGIYLACLLFAGAFILTTIGMLKMKKEIKEIKITISSKNEKTE